MKVKYDKLLGTIRESDSETSEIVFTSSTGGKIYRFRILTNVLQLDKAITELGFDGVEDTDWLNINSFA